MHKGDLQFLKVHKPRKRVGGNLGDPILMQVSKITTRRTRNNTLSTHDTHTQRPPGSGVRIASRVLRYTTNIAECKMLCWDTGVIPTAQHKLESGGRRRDNEQIIGGNHVCTKGTYNFWRFSSPENASAGISVIRF